ncbi:hypothetical protein, partial [Enterococcus hirae]|uniref:hypothetical protein n=1 Tax=Enterococcus hirae TaxID=1354 RepID=UPI0019D4E0D4
HNCLNFLNKRTNFSQPVTVMADMLTKRDMDIRRNLLFCGIGCFIDFCSPESYFILFLSYVIKQL